MAAAVFLALLVKEEPGYVLIGWKVWTLETSLAWFLILDVIVIALVYAVVRLWVNTLTIPSRFRAWRSRRSARRARRALNKGLVELSEGHWQGAEKSLLRYADHSESPLLNYLAAARSAQQQGAHERRDQYLQLAHESMPSADVAVGLTQAELQLAHEQLEQALATLMHLRSIAPKHAYVLKLLMTLYKRLEDWSQLRDLIPELRKQKVVDEAELLHLQVIIYTGLLNQAAQASAAEQLAQEWAKIPKNLRTNESLVDCYARHLLARGQDDQAEALLRDAMKRQWSEDLAELYGQVEATDSGKQLSTAEEWLSSHPRNPVLLQTLGQLCMRCKLWGKARSYLEASIGAGPMPAAYRVLGALLEQMEEPEKAMECYRAGLSLSAGADLSALPSQEGELIKAGEEDTRLESVAADANAPKKAASV
jgi:HemY protein